MFKIKDCIFILFHIVYFISYTNANKCEVCVGVVTRLINKLQESGKITDEAHIKKEFLEMCKGIKERKESKFCYEVGAHEDSPTSTINELTKPISTHLPAEIACQKLKNFAPQICDLHYDKPIDWKNIDFKKLKVRELKKILNGWNEECHDCLEKGDFIKRIMELKTKYVKEEL